MSNRLFIPLAIGIFVVSFVTVWSMTGKAQTMAPTSTVCEARVVCVTLQKDHASPDVVAVPVGDYIQFNANDTLTHNLALGEGDEHHTGTHVHKAGIESGFFSGDSAWKIQLKQAGSYEFHDHLHPTIGATVIVYTPGADYKIR